MLKKEIEHRTPIHSFLYFSILGWVGVEPHFTDRLRCVFHHVLLIVFRKSRSAVSISTVMVLPKMSKTCQRHVNIDPGPPRKREKKDSDAAGRSFTDVARPRVRRRKNTIGYNHPYSVFGMLYFL